MRFRTFATVSPSAPGQSQDDQRKSLPLHYLHPHFTKFAKESFLLLVGTESSRSFISTPHMYPYKVKLKRNENSGALGYKYYR
jgi:hypothetical protein